MDKATAFVRFQTKFEKGIGNESNLEKKLTPESRVFKSILEKPPVYAIRVILEGLSIRKQEMISPPVVIMQEKAKKYISILYSGIAAVFSVCISFFFSFPAVVALPFIAISVMLATFWAEKNTCVQRKTQQMAEQITEDCTIEVDEATMDRVAETFQQSIERIVNYVRQKEEDLELGYDVTRSKSFGEWIQKFVDYTRRHTENRDLEVLKEEFVSKLLTMGIEVFDTLEEDEKTGMIILPERTCYRDGRSEDGIPFSKVTHVVVSSRRGVLAVGEIK